jgi:hypothetical protein
MKLKNKIKKKDKNKKIAIKRMKTRLDTKIERNKMMNDEIEKNQFKKTLKIKQIIIRIMRVQINTNTN